MKDIKEFGGLYAITEDGKVWSYPTKKKGIQGGHSGKFLSIKPRKDGYVVAILRKDSKYHARYLHRIIAEAYIPNPKNLREVNHIDGIKVNNRISNLEWVSRQENMAHARKNGFTRGKDKIKRKEYR